MRARAFSGPNAPSSPSPRRPTPPDSSLRQPDTPAQRSTAPVPVAASCGRCTRGSPTARALGTRRGSARPSRYARSVGGRPACLLGVGALGGRQHLQEQILRLRQREQPRCEHVGPRPARPSLDRSEQLRAPTNSRPCPSSELVDVSSVHRACELRPLRWAASPWLALFHVGVVVERRSRFHFRSRAPKGEGDARSLGDGTDYDSRMNCLGATHRRGAGDEQGVIHSARR